MTASATPRKRKLLLAGVLLALGDRGAWADEVGAGLDELNARWAGAEATLRAAIPLSRRPESGGAWGMYAGFEEGARWHRAEQQVSLEGQPYFVYWMLAESPASGGALAGGDLPAGTELEVQGWRFTDPARRLGPFLEMRVRGTAARLKVGYDRHVGRAKAATASPEWLGAVERHLRFAALELRPASQRLAAPPSPGGNAPAPSVLKLIAVAASPARVAAGEQIEVALTYEVAGAACEVRERREVLRAGSVLGRFDDPLLRAIGLHASKKRISVPPSAPPGSYEVRAELSCAATVAAGSALFEVR